MTLKPTWFKALIFFFVVGMIALLYWVTLVDTEDPCASPQADISGAVLADDPGSQDALVNRAIIMRGACDKAEDRNQDEGESNGKPNDD